MAFDDEGLRLHHRLVRRTPRAEAVTMLAESALEERAQHLRQRLLDQAIQHGRHAEGTLRPIGFRDEHPAHCRRTVGPVL